VALYVGREWQRTPPKLVRGLSLLDATMIVVGSMIGSGIFITSLNRRGSSARRAGCCGVGARGRAHDHGRAVLRELAAMWPRAGGQYVFCAKLMGHRSGFFSAGACF
jgi:APA family basic amino acid/polyamine antiporter